MIVVCKDLDARLDQAWYRLQIAIFNNTDHPMSQIDLDTTTVEVIERLAQKIQAKHPSHHAMLADKE